MIGQEQVSFISYLSGGAIYCALTLVFIYLWRQRISHFSLVLAALGSLAWSFSIAAIYQNLNPGRPLLTLLEILRYGLWITALLSYLKFSAGQGLPQRFQIAVHSVWVIALAGTGVLALMRHPLADSTDLTIWSGILLSIAGLVAVEQLYRNTQQFRLIKLLSVTVGALFAYDIYMFAHSLVFHSIDEPLWQARGAINGLAALAMALGALGVASQQNQHARLAISRPVVFYTTSLTVAGCFLALMAVGGYYVQVYGGRWGSVIQIIVLFSALLSIAVVFISKTVRSHLSVWINKNFFHHKYDYRVEWLQLINSLSRNISNEDFHQRAISAVAAIFKSPGGGLWLRNSHSFHPVCTQNLTLPPENITEPLDTPFCRALKKHEWVFSPHSPDNDKLSALNDVLPVWIYHVPDLWLVLPLLTEDELLGFMVLTEPELDSALTWEDLDLLKTVGRQVASYLDRHEAAELLAESRQFDIFNKLTAFIMHDLKNLIAQQALVVENAAKHKENPAFVEDAIHTIENSVARMSNLLKKLQQNEPSELRDLDLQKVLMEAVKKCQDTKPTPSLRLEDNEIRVNADQDRLIMTLVHVIRNAQEATPNTGFVDVTLRREANNAIITVEDNGAGMAPEFVRNQLFKPFVTTKSGKGMGIGVYQTKEFISALGGSVDVDSIPGEGTTFTITLPIVFR